MPDSLPLGNSPQAPPFNLKSARLMMAAAVLPTVVLKLTPDTMRTKDGEESIGELLFTEDQQLFTLKRFFTDSDAKDVDKAIIRTHGIPKKDLETLVKSDVQVINATCPYVTKPQEICEKMSMEGYEIVIFGDADHPEVKGVESYAIHGAHVVQSVAELEKVKFKGNKIAVGSQKSHYKSY
jgi:4-hydroxy-3-methylbut-2-enyl diphosphate reductase IspH